MTIPTRTAEAVGSWAGTSLLASTVVMRMFNITPDGQEAWAVEASQRRR